MIFALTSKDFDGALSMIGNQIIKPSLTVLPSPFVASLLNRSRNSPDHRMRAAGPPGPIAPGSASEWMMTSKRGRPWRAPEQPCGSVRLPAEPLRGQNPHRHATWGRRRWRPEHRPSVSRSERPQVGTRQPRLRLQVTPPGVITAVPG